MRKFRRSVVVVATLCLSISVTACGFMDGGASDLKSAQKSVMSNTTTLCSPSEKTNKQKARADLVDSVLKYYTAYMSAAGTTKQDFPTVGNIMGGAATTCQEADEVMDTMIRQTNKYNFQPVNPSTTNKEE